MSLGREERRTEREIRRRGIGGDGGVSAEGVGTEFEMEGVKRSSRAAEASKVAWQTNVSVKCK